MLALTALGAVLLATELPPLIDTQPLPGPNLQIRLEAAVRFGGDYFVEVTMPKVGNALALAARVLMFAGLLGLLIMEFKPMLKKRDDAK